MGRKSDYSTDMFRQMQEIMERLSEMETINTQNQKKLKEADADISSMRRTIAKQEAEIEALNETVTALRSENTKLVQENRLLRDDNERMKRILNNNSHNSSLSPSTDQKKSSAIDTSDHKEDNEEDMEKQGKPANTYNGRKSTKNKKGGQAGHHGTTLTKKTVEEKIQEGKFAHQVKTIGQESGDYIVRYVLDLSIGVTATEIRIYADENGKFQIPKEYAAEVTYGSNIRAVTSMLYSEGVMSSENGRDSSCEIVIDNNFISRKHAHLQKEFGKWYLYDDHSTNGTMLNGVSITAGIKYELRNGDVISPGRHLDIVFMQPSDMTASLPYPMTHAEFY